MFARFLSFWRQAQIKILVRLVWQGKIVCSRCRFNVPVRVYESRGTIVIGERTFLGFQAAPKYGSGAILLQAREADSKIVIGEGGAFSNNVSIVAKKSIVIGKRFLCGDMVYITDSDFHGIAVEERHLDGKTIPVKIGDNVWMGSRVMVLKGVEIGDGSVIAAGSVVVSDIPPNSVAAGVPAKVIRQCYGAPTMTGGSLL